MSDSSLHNAPKALLLIDVQEGFFTIPEFHIHQAGAFLSRVSQLVTLARTEGVPVIHVQHCGPPGHPLERGSDGGRIHSAVSPEARELVVQKEESDAFLGTSLHAELETLGVTDLIICGMQSEYCVDTTCRRAHGLGYRVTLVGDGHTTGDAGELEAEQIIAHHNETLANGFVTVREAADVAALL